MNTRLLYQQDAYIREFETEIIGVSGEDNKILLPETVFYPGGGGQPPDAGWIYLGDTGFRVTGFEKSDDNLWHIVERGPFTIGSRVKAVIDWERRHNLMRTHSAMHVLCGVIWRDYHAPVTGGNMEPLNGRMDFEFEKMEAGLVREIEQKVNDEILLGREIFVKILSREEAEKIPDLIRTKINLLPAGLTRIRTVEIKGLDLQADGGTHVANTREIGKIQIYDYQSKGRINKRVKIRILDS
jgi:misacylated tRNA(Ala) deacylase